MLESRPDTAAGTPPPPRTVHELFESGGRRAGPDQFLRFKRNGEWQSLSFDEVAERVRDLALGLHTRGIRKGDRLAIWSENRPEWNVIDLAVLAAGAVDVPIYT